MPELELSYVPIASLHANGWNPNRQSEAVAKAEAESIETFGFLDPVTVRPHPEHPGEWEVIDGEHRLREAERQGMTHIPIVPIEATDEQARKLTIILNETRGEADIVALGQLLAELSEGMSTEELLHGLALTGSELDHLLSLAATEWDGYGGALPEAGDAQGDGGGTFTLSGDPIAVEALRTKLASLAEAMETDELDACLVAVEEALASRAAM